MMKTVLSTLLLLGSLFPACAATRSPAEQWKGYAWHFEGMELNCHGDAEKTVGGEIWRDVRTASVTGRTWTVEIVGGPRTNETNTVVFTSACSVPPDVLRPGENLRLSLAASCTGACTARCDHVFAKWGSDRDEDPKPDEAFELVDGDLLAGLGTNVIALCASNGTPRAFAGTYAKNIPFGRRSGNKTSVTFHGSGAITKWSYVWRQDPLAEARERRARQIERALQTGTELKEAVAALNAKEADFWDMFDMVFPEEAEVKAAADDADATDANGGASFFGRMVRWLFGLSMVALVLAFVRRHLDDLREFHPVGEGKWRRLGERVLQGCRLFALFVFDLALKGGAWAWRKGVESKKWIEARIEERKRDGK